MYEVNVITLGPRSPFSPWAPAGPCGPGAPGIPGGPSRPDSPSLPYNSIVLIQPSIKTHITHAWSSISLDSRWPSVSSITLYTRHVINNP